MTLKYIGLILCAFASLGADALVKRTQVLMGTYVSVALEDKDIVHSSHVFRRLKEVENALSSYSPSAQVYRLNHDKEVLLSEDTYRALRLCESYYHLTEGYFDITIGSITKDLFHFGEEQRVPQRHELLRARVDLKGLHFNQERAWLDEDVTIDLGGMGKGFGVDRAKEVLQEQGVLSGVIALSGDIFCFHQCQMQIQDPFNEGSFAYFRMAYPKTGISTSGNYRRYVKSKEHHHLINPKTRESSKSFASITLISRTHSNSDLDAFATAASVMPRSKAVTFLDAQTGLGYLLVDVNKKISVNDRFKALTQNLKIYVLKDSPERGYIIVRPSRFQNSKKPGLLSKQKD